MKSFLKTSAAFLAIFAFIFSYSCKQEPAEDVHAELINAVTFTDSEVKDEIVIEEIIDDLLEDLNQYEFKKSVSECPVITTERPEETKYPKIVTKDYGEGCTNKWGVERSGKIIVKVWGNWLTEGSKREVSFENYTHRGRAIDGKKHIICNGLNEDSLYMHTIKGELTIEKNDSTVIYREIHKKRVLLSGAKNPDVPKEWIINGHAKVTKSNGIAYQVSIKDKYRIQGCKWPQLGLKVLHFTADENKSMKKNHKISIDYSYFEEESPCDNLALRKVDNEEAEVITLR